MDAEARLAALERRVAALYNEPDPGLPCPMASLRHCEGGQDVRFYAEPGSLCKTCKGAGRVFPPMPPPPRPQT